MAERTGLSSWYDLPDCNALLEAISNLRRQDLSALGGIIDTLPGRVNTCLDEGKISSEQAQTALSHLESLTSRKK